MTCVLFIIALLVLACLLAYVRARLSVWTLAFGALLAVLSTFTAPGIIIIAIWIIFVAIALMLNLTPLRRALLSRPIFSWFKRALPAMSRTEQEAIEAGTVWWDGELFSGKPDWRKLLAFPVPKLSVEEQAFLDGPVEQLCALLDDWHITHERADLPPEAWRFIKEHWTELEPKITISLGDVRLVEGLGVFCDAASRDDIRAFFTVHKLPAAARALDQTIERINNCMALKEQQSAPLTAWLTARGI